MTGRRYYITTLGGWRRHAPRFVNSHFILLKPAAEPFALHATQHAQDGAANADALAALDETSPVITLIEADEGAHLVLEDDAEFEALPHPLAQKSISGAAQAALAQQGIKPGATTFDAAEAIARIHPLLRHRVF